VFTAPETVKIVDEDGCLDGGDVLLGWHVDLASLFATLDQGGPTSSE